MCTMSWGVLYSFYIDGMLFEFCIEFLNIEQKILDFFFNISCFLQIVWYFQHLNKIWCTKEFSWGGGGGGGGLEF